MSVNIKVFSEPFRLYTACKNITIVNWSWLSLDTLPRTLLWFTCNFWVAPPTANCTTLTVCSCGKSLKRWLRCITILLWIQPPNLGLSFHKLAAFQKIIWKCSHTVLLSVWIRCHLRGKSFLVLSLTGFVWVCTHSYWSVYMKTKM